MSRTPALSRTTRSLGSGFSTAAAPARHPRGFHRAECADAPLIDPVSVFVRALAVDLSPSCAPAHIRQKTRGAVSRQIGREADHRGDTAMTKFFRSADAAEIYSLEHRFPFVPPLISVFMAGNVGS